MAIIQLMHKEEVGKTTEVVDGHVEVKINNEMKGDLIWI